MSINVLVDIVNGTPPIEVTGISVTVVMEQDCVFSQLKVVGITSSHGSMARTGSVLDALGV